MQLDLYKQQFGIYFNSPAIQQSIAESVVLIKNKAERIFFAGNGGSNSICSHMMEDFAKIARYSTFTFSDAALITCFSNDYGYDKAMEEWLKIYFSEKDLLVAISSSGESENILNAAKYVKSKGGALITLSGFKEGNRLSRIGDINFHLGISNYGIVECFHQVILHIILDSLNDK